MRYSYQGIDKKGKKYRGEREANSISELRKKLKKEGINLVKAVPIKKGGKKRKKNSIFSTIKRKEIVLFTRQLATMLDAGIPLLRTISILTEQNENIKFKEILEGVVRDLNSGVDLSTSIAKYPNQFDKLYVNMVKAGEASGSLETVLKRLAKSMEESEEIKGKVKGAMTYPIIVILISIIIVFGLMSFVVPRFKMMFDQFGKDLPSFTQFIFNVSDFFAKNWIIILGLTGVGLFLIYKYISTEKGKYNFHKFILKLPIFGPLNRKVAVSRFTRTMSTLLESGVNILTAFEIAGDTSGNTVISKVIEKSKISIREGNTLAKPLKESGEFPIMVTQMIEVGEESGTLIDMLAKVSDFQDVEVNETIQQALAALEPLAILVMAVFVGSIVIGLFLPLTQISDLVG
ncbi:type IV pilus assembly protein PilC [Hypnocyclicus thermotrophus]|uniref:Type IV pilus assembly protein PilC n=1 Tax=Hypnocyclicus thermotrophus TaxID=1627895 RepID=A0AA46DY84_9FUSO|nr:type II secretion system F family protein [Hypnocyclicus thermotrophus]TDT69800.1 type IV pilus assembly protein PilC [Hypnocyclicus thermotrophus]